MLNRPPADLSIAIAEAPPLVALILEDVGIDGADLDAGLFSVGDDVWIETLGKIPKDVNRNVGTYPGELVNPPRIVELVLDGSRGGRLVEFAEPRAGIGITPRRGFNHEALQPIDGLRRV